jgi:hypothetical protein
MSDDDTQDETSIDDEQVIDGTLVPATVENSFLGKAEKKAKMLERRMKIAVLHHRGITNQRRLAAALECSLSTVRKDLAWLFRQWRRECVDDIRNAKAKSIAELSYTRNELWEAWRRSKSDFRETRTVTTRESKDDEDPTIVTTTVTRKQNGDPRYLEQIIRIMLAEGRIMGVDGEVKVNLGDTKLSIDLGSMIKVIEADQHRVCDEDFIEQVVNARAEELGVIDAHSVPSNGQGDNGDGKSRTQNGDSSVQ